MYGSRGASTSPTGGFNIIKNSGRKITPAELLADRWADLRQMMEREGLDYLLAFGRGVPAEYGPFQYLSGVFPGHRGSLVAIARDGPVTLFATSETERLALQIEIAPEVEIVTVQQAGTQHPLDAFLRRIGGGTKLSLGLLGGVAMPQQDYGRLMSAFAASGQISDATQAFNAVRALKRPADIAGLRRGAAIADEGFTILQGDARALTERGIVGAVSGKVKAQGASTELIYASVGPFTGHRPTTRNLAAGDLLSLCVEIATPDGYWVEIGRLFAVGTLDKMSQAAADSCLRSLARGAEALRPGAACSDVASAMLEVLSRDGFKPSAGLGHGVGIDEEPPAVSQSSDAKLREGMAIVLHPSANRNGSVGALVADTYVITKTGAESLSGYSGQLGQLTMR